MPQVSPGPSRSTRPTTCWLSPQGETYQHSEPPPPPEAYTTDSWQQRWQL